MPLYERTQTKIRFWKVVLVILALSFIALEVLARIYTGIYWHKLERAYFLDISEVHGRWASHTYLPYVLAPNYSYNANVHNSLGFRGPEISVAKSPETTRIVAIGASTTYGTHVGVSEAAYPAQLEQLFKSEGRNVEVINAGVPGWVSTENLINLKLKILPLKPDIIIVYQGRNELFAQAYNNYKPDYSHLRTSNYSFLHTNLNHKRIFRVSRLAMLLTSIRPAWFGWDNYAEHPGYGQNRYENIPTLQELIGNLEDPSTTETYRSNLRSMIGIARAHGIEIVLATMAFRAEKFGSSVLPLGLIATTPEDRATAIEALAAQMEENNRIVREVAAEYGVLVAELAALSARPELFKDDCHFGREGHTERAIILRETLRNSGLL